MDANVGALLAAAPKLMRALTIIGTIAMFMVGGGLLNHGIAPLRHLAESAAEAASRAKLTAYQVCDLAAARRQRSKPEAHTR